MRPSRQIACEAKQSRNARGKNGRLFWSFLPLVLLLMGSPTAHAASPYSLDTDVSQASVGDVIRPTFSMNLGVGLVGLFEYSYKIPNTARYIPNSFKWNGVPVPDSDPRLSISETDVRMSLANVPGATTVFELRLRVTGSIGEAVHHTSEVSGIIPTQIVRCEPTRIEDETAILIIPDLEKDASITEAEPSWNHGVSSTLLAVRSPIENTNSLLDFDLGTISSLLPFGWEVQAAYLELYPVSLLGDGKLQVRPVKQAWVEGTMDAAPCISGVTWTASNCLKGWANGGDLDKQVTEAQISEGRSYLQLDLTSYIQGWVKNRDPEFGFALKVATGTCELVIPSRETNNNSTLAPRLVVVAAPVGSYSAKAASRVEAEIIPTRVIAGTGDTRFEYWLLPEVLFGDTGVNRFTVSIPNEYQLTSIDSFVVGGVVYDLGDGEDLAHHQYENWGNSSQIDLRFSPKMSWFDGGLPVKLVLHAIVPANATTDRAFPSTFDDDRRGQPTSNANEGDAHISGGPGDENRWRVEAISSQVIRIAVSPSDTNLAIGYDVEYKALAVFQDSSRIDVTSSALWDVAPGILGDIDSLGVFSASAVGSGVVSATWNDLISNAATLQVAPAEVISMFITPGSQSIAVGSNAAYVATGVYSSGDSLDLTATATWTLDDPTIATFNSPGNLTGLLPGSTLLHASISGFTVPAFLTVTPAELVKIEIAPADTSVAEGFDVQLAAIGTYSDSTSGEITSIVSWNSTPPGIVDIGVTGLTTTLAEGIASISASLTDVQSNTATLAVTPAIVVSLDGNPDSASVTVLGFHSVRSWATYSNDDTVEKTSFVTWRSLDPGIADFVGPGTVEALSPGLARLAHSLGGIQGDTLKVNVTNASIDSLVVHPSQLTLPPITHYSLLATGYWSDGSDQDVTLQSIWSSDDLVVATVDSTGTITANAEGSAIISAEFGSFTSFCSLTVSNTAFDSLVIQPTESLVPVGLTASTSALAFRSGVPLDVTASALWSTSDTLIAVVGSQGTVTGRSIGMTNLNASLAGLSASPASIRVTPAVVSRVEVQPASTTLRLGAGKQLTALATYSDDQVVDITTMAQWNSLSPSTVFMQNDGIALGLSLGNAGVLATWDEVASAPASLRVLPSVQLETLPIGNIPATPGTSEALLLSLRLRNNDVQPHELAALRFTVAGPAESLCVWLDDGDGIFEPGSDLLTNKGIAANGRWTANNINAVLPVAGWKTLFLSCDVSKTNASHGETIDAVITSEADLFWDTPTATVSPTGFPLDSFGQVTSQDLVLSQIDFQPQPADTIFPGAEEIALLVCSLPDDGGVSDTMTSITVRQIGSAIAGVDIAGLHLQTMQDNQLATVPLAGSDPRTSSGPWQDVATLVHTGANQWVASGLSVPILPSTPKTMRIVAILATTAQEGRTIQVELPALAMSFSSGRVGPLNSGWLNPNAALIEAQHQLIITQTLVEPPSNPISRHAGPQTVLGLELTAWAANDDALTQLTLNHISTGPTGPAGDVDAQITTARLWLDGDQNGRINLPNDTQVGTSLPGALVSGEIEFGTVTPINVRLPVAEPVHLLVSLTMNPELVRDAEFLRVQLGSNQQVRTQGSLDVVLPTSLQTLTPPQVDGQEVDGYDVHSLNGSVLLTKTANAPVFDFAIPANGVDDDILSRIRLENLGDATNSDIKNVRLLKDNGNDLVDNGDSLVAVLVSVGSRAWEAGTIGLPLQRTDTRRYWITVDVNANAISGRTFQGSIPLGGVEVSSGNDGPIDQPLIGGESHVISVQNRVTWLAGSAEDELVPPDAMNQSILILEAFNGYSNLRTLNSLDVAIRGSAAPQEYQLWRLYSDENGNGEVDASDINLAIASIGNGRVLFSGFQWDMQPQLQQRLLVSYSLNPESVRDASIVDAVVESENSFGYVQSTQSIGSFELDSPGVDVVNGMLLSQVGNFGVPQRSLGGGETDVLTLDLLLPSNGWQEDTLRTLRVQLPSVPQIAVVGSDILEIELWQESDSSPTSAQFNAAQDIYLQRAVSNGGNLLFSELSSMIPVGGQRFYVTVDMASNPTDAAHVQLIVPVSGIVMESGNDGPLDSSLEDTAVHTVSSSDLLASANVQPLVASVGQQVTLEVTVRNQGSAQLDSVFVSELTVDPPGSAALVSGPTPGFISLPAQSDNTINYVFNMTTAGDVQFTVVTVEMSGPRQSDPATSSPVHVEQPPTGLSLSAVSNLPPSVNRGQGSVTPLIWQLAHPDTDPLAADISIDTVQLYVQDTGGSAQIASDVFSSLEIRTGGQLHAYWSTIPADTVLNVPLDIPVVLAPGEQRDLPLTVTIATDAVASGFQMHLAGNGAIGAEDANSGQPVTLLADLPWSTQSANILTPATSIQLLTTSTLPAGINGGQLDVPGGSLTFVLPGAPGESEARVTQLGLTFEEAGQPVLAEDLISRVRVRHGTTTLLDLQTIQSEAQALPLQLTIPKVVASGDSVQLDLSFDLRNATSATQLEIVVPDSSFIEVRDSNSGTTVPVSLAGGGSFPWKQGPALIQTAAQLVNVATVSTVPTSTFPGAPQMQILDLTLANMDPPGSASMWIESLALEVLDEIGSPQFPTSVVTTARWYTGNSLTAQTSVATGSRMVLIPSVALSLAPGESLVVSLQVDLTANLTDPWIRFHLPSDALSLRDTNDPAQTITVIGMPASTALTRVVAEASAVALGVLDEPPTNVVPGTNATALLPIRIEHPGADNEADIQPQMLVLKLRDVVSQPLPASAIAIACHAVWDSVSIAAGTGTDSLAFDLTSLPPLAVGESMDLTVQMDLATTISVSDFRIFLPADALMATSGSGQTLALQATGSFGLPYESPTVHVTAGSLEESFASYPNPFIPSQGACHITFFLVGDSRVTCDIYTLSGDRVAGILEGASLASGLHDNLTWDGRNERGDLVRNGTYLLRIQVDGTGGGEFYRKLAVIR